MRWTLGCCALAISALVSAPLARAQEADASAAAAQTAAPEEAKREPITNIGGSAPAETPAERIERFKRERGAGSDKPFEGFAAQAEQEMERQRQAAIGARTVEQEQAEASVESRVEARETVQDRLTALGAWGGSMCTEVEPAWNVQEEFIRHRKLRADDFRSERDMSAAAVRVPNAATVGFAAILFSCELQPLVQKARDDLFVARIVRVRYYAVLSRKDSWLAEHPESREKFMIGHQQLHFDMADSFADWLNRNRETTLASMQGAGTSPEVAVGRLQLRWGEHMLAVYDDFDRLETAFDRDTKHGAEPEKQTEWSFRMSDGFEALAKGIKLETRVKAK
jgi:hypothetical protein